MFCSNCGAKNAKAYKFCGECGSPAPAAQPKVAKPESVVPPVVLETPAEFWAQPAKKGFLNTKTFIIAGAAFVAVIALVAGFILLRPQPTLATVDKYMFTISDALPTPISDDTEFDTDWLGDARIFAEDCAPQEKMDSIEPSGLSWGRVSFGREDSDTNTFLMTEQIVGFPDDATATNYIDAARAGFNDPDCLTSTPNPKSYSIQEKFGIGVDGLYMVLDYEDSTSLYGLAFARRGSVVMITAIFAGEDSTDLYSKDVSYTEMETLLGKAISKFNQ